MNDKSFKDFCINDCKVTARKAASTPQEGHLTSLGAPGSFFGVCAAANPALWAMKIVFTHFKKTVIHRLKAVSHHMGVVRNSETPGDIGGPTILDNLITSTYEYSLCVPFLKSLILLSTQFTKLLQLSFNTHPKVSVPVESWELNQKRPPKHHTLLSLSHPLNDTWHRIQ